MKRYLFAIVAVLFSTLGVKAMSYEEAREQAYYLTDKMAYELNLNDQQYNDAYEINLDYLLNLNTEADLYGTYLEYRNADLRYILYDWQWSVFAAADYFFRPVWWYNGGWLFPIYNHYVRGYFWFDRPGCFWDYRGAHGRAHFMGRSFYADRRPGWDGGMRGRGRDCVGSPTGRGGGRYGGESMGRGSMNQGRGSMNSGRGSMNQGRGTSEMNSGRSGMNQGRGTYNNGSSRSSMQNTNGRGTSSEMNTRSNSTYNRGSMGTTSGRGTYNNSSSRSTVQQNSGMRSSSRSSIGTSSMGRSSMGSSSSRGSMSMPSSRSSFSGSSSMGGSRGGASMGGGSFGGGSRGGGSSMGGGSRGGGGRGR